MKISLEEPTHIFKPFSQVRGSITGPLNAPIDLQLLWQTKGSGARVRQVVDQQTLSLETGNHFSFTIPNGPYSFNGALLALLWSIELLRNRELLDSTGLVVSPTGEMYDLKRIVFPDSADLAEIKSQGALLKIKPELKKQMEDYRAIDSD